MRYVNQLEYPYIMYQTNTEHPEDVRRDHGTYAMSGCGLSSAIMILDRLTPNYKCDLFDAVDLAYKTNANHALGTDYLIYAPAFAEKFGLEYLFTNSTEEVFNCLATGGAVVALSTGDYKDHIGLFTHGAHYIALVSRLRDGRVAILDPSQTPEKFEEEGRKGKVQVDGNLIYTDIENVVKDFSIERVKSLGYEGNAKIFTCFWKKIG